MIEVWSWPTPNGHKVHIALEELGLPYRIVPVDIGAGEQFKPEFLAITPNHRIPAIVDPDGPGGKALRLFESGAILIYLAEKAGRADPRRPGRALYVPAMADVPDGRRRADVRPVEPFRKLCAREAAVRDRALHERGGAPAIACSTSGSGRRSTSPGAEYSIADIATWPWVAQPGPARRRSRRLPHLARWLDAVAARPAVQRGVAVLSDHQRRGPMDDAQREVLFGKTQFATR